MAFTDFFTDENGKVKGVVWIAGAGIVGVGAIMLLGSKSSSTTSAQDQSGQSSDITSMLDNLNQAILALAQSKSSGSGSGNNPPPSGGGGGGSGSGGYKPPFGGGTVYPPVFRRPVEPPTQNPPTNQPYKTFIQGVFAVVKPVQPPTTIPESTTPLVNPTNSHPSANTALTPSVAPAQTGVSSGHLGATSAVKAAEITRKYTVEPTRAY